MTKKATTTSTKKPATDSKKANAIKIVKRMLGRKNVPERKDIINELVTKAGLSVNGAATYYQNVKSGKWS